MRGRHGYTKSLLLFGLVLCMKAAGCGDDDAPRHPAMCAGEGCSCNQANDCVCTAGDDCKATCVECSLTCDDGAKCNAEASGAVAVACSDSSECKGNGGNGSVLTCRESSHCNLKSGADSLASCEDSSDCKINVGPGSTVICKDSAHCEVKCDDGDCEVACDSGTNCSLNCGPDDGGKPGTECPDGRLICGSDC
jgi:hypothetical protein